MMSRDHPRREPLNSIKRPAGRSTLERAEEQLEREGELNIDVGRSYRHLGTLLLITGLIGLLSGWIVRGFHGGLLPFPLFFGAVGAALLSNSYRIRADRTGITVRKIGSRTSIDYSEITALFCFPQPRSRAVSLVANAASETPVDERLRGFYHIEGRGGRELTIPLGPTRGAAELRAILEARSGLHWTNVDQPARIGDQLEELRKISGKSGVSLAWWICRHLFELRLERAGLPLPAHRLVVGAATIPIAAAGFLYIAGMVTMGPDDTPLHTLLPWWVYLSVSLIVAGGTLLTINLLALFLRVERRRREGIQAELIAAQEVQRRLLPQGPPSLPGWELAAHYVPAKQVAGDYFDFIPLEGGRTAVVIADVSGKGLPAGLLMTMAKGHLTARLEGGDSALDALVRLDRRIRLSSAGRGRMFVTMALLVLHENGHVELIRAGHDPPLLIDQGNDARWLEPAGVALGIDPRNEFGQRCTAEYLELEPGDCIFLYTDGLVEARTSDEIEYGRERLKKLVSGTPTRGASALLQRVADDLATFVGTAPAGDDVTLVAIARSPQR